MLNATRIWGLRPRRCLPPLRREVVPAINAARRMVASCEPASAHADGPAVLLVPGLFAGDRWLHPLRRHLEASGYDVWDSTIACNVACSESTATRLLARLEEIAQRKAPQ